MELKPGYRRSEAGIVPEDWQVARLLSVVRIAKGQVDPKHEPYRSMILIAPDHIETGTGRLLELSTAAEQNAISGKYTFDRGDIVYSKIRPHLRKVVLAQFSGICSADMYPLRPEKDVSSGFIFASILGERFSRFAESVSVRSGMPKINRAELGEFYLALPALKEEQDSIARVLSDADALIESLEQLLAKKRQVKQGAMRELLTARRRLPGFSGDWREESLGELGRWTGGMTPSMRRTDYWNPAEIPWISSGDVKSTKLTRTGFSVSRRAVQEGATTLVPANALVLVVRSGILRKYLPVATTTVQMAINQDIKALAPRSSVKAEFLLQSLMFNGSAILARCLKSGTTVESIELRWLKDFRISLPSYSEQLAVAEVLSHMDREIEDVEAEIGKVRRLKDGMMQQLLTGRIRLVDAKPAEDLELVQSA